MPQTLPFVTAFEKIFFRTRRVKAETASFPRKVPIWGSFCGVLPIIQHFCPTWPMLSPIAELSLQTGNRTPNLEFAATKYKISPPPDECCPQLRNLVPKPEIGRPIWNLGTKK